MSTERELQRELTRTALTILGDRSFALAGSGAIREHGIADRATRAVDLFTSDVDPAAFDSGVDALVLHLERAGFVVDVVRRSSRFAQLRVTVGGGRSVDMDLAVDWRETEPDHLAIGPVLSLRDAVGSKVDALFTRAEARDYLDVDAIRRSGLFSDQISWTRCAASGSNEWNATVSTPRNWTRRRSGWCGGRRRCARKPGRVRIRTTILRSSSGAERRGGVER
ncbi:nucleotidyl transferase AbiEii/AbiGii toxin family protein [Herbiconiux moechotypicola]|uniref:Nucleotidyl transferase AbiEii/AbiGii toxin family protein n=1 Tax=Herbiconiux moechotypicola TaxID=637393 RepID=A0ABN3DW37_9MICO|nr:nucleotidyl transferase AbiEii/AbiGii toxin family protein [Herbiconiux moechotypicola]MCS5730930.1 nucleotidyl transferase AbiEii/AbiGii toxin family protein [Herbiconiux moechotypicola]